MTEVSWKDQLLEKNHKEHIHNLAVWVVNEGRIEELLSLMVNATDRYAQKAAWVLNHVVHLQPKLLQLHASLLVNILQQDNHVGVRRSIFQALEQLTFNEDQTSFLVEESFAALTNEKESIAVQVYAMSLLFNLCQPFPELLSELRQTISFKLHEKSPGYKSRAKKIIEKINRQRELKKD